MISEMKKQGVIKPSMRPWASPVILVPKKDGMLWFCVDYRQLNSITTKDVCPLPRINDILDKRGEAHFSTLDLCSQVELDEGSRQKTAFTTHNGVCKNVMQHTGNYSTTNASCFVWFGMGHLYFLMASRTFEDRLRHLPNF
jgi:hypothetical protein